MLELVVLIWTLLGDQLETCCINTKKVLFVPHHRLDYLLTIGVDIVRLGRLRLGRLRLKKYFYGFSNTLLVIFIIYRH